MWFIAFKILNKFSKGSTENLTNKNVMEICKVEKLLNLDNISNTFKKSLTNKLYPENVCFFYEVMKHFNYKYINICLFKYIQRWFCLVIENNQLLDLNFDSIKDFLSNDGLKISTEIEIFNVADCWIQHNSKERSKFAIELIKLVRLPLLSSASLNSLLNTENSFSKCRRSKEHINSIFKEKQFNILSKDCQSRYFTQDDFYITADYGWKKDLETYKIYNSKESISKYIVSCTAPENYVARLLMELFIF